MNQRLVRLFVIAVALIVVSGATGVVLAASSTSSGKAQTQIKVVRENSTTASATSVSTSFVDIPNATTSMTVPAGTSALLVARFQGHGSIIQTTGCIVRILVGGTTMEPNGNYPFMGQASSTGSTATSGMIERSLQVSAGTYTVKAQLRLVTAASVSSQCQLTGWHFAVERHKR